MEKSERFLGVLGYFSDRKPTFESGSIREFLGQVKTSDDMYLADEVKEIKVIFQFTDEEVERTLSTQAYRKIGWGKEVKNAHSFIFCAVELKGTDYYLTQLSRILKRVNRVYNGIPCAVMFKYRGYLSIAIVGRRPNLRDSGEDVQFRVSTIRRIPLDWRLSQYRTDILYGLSFDKCLEWVKDSGSEYNFDGLMKAWLMTLKYKNASKDFLRDSKDQQYWNEGTTQLEETPEISYSEQALKREEFERSTTEHTKKILQQLGSLSDCADKRFYDYTKNDINQIFSTIEREIELTKQKFDTGNGDGQPTSNEETKHPIPPTQTNRELIGYTLYGKKYNVRNSKEGIVGLFNLFIARDPGFMKRFKRMHPKYWNKTNGKLSQGNITSCIKDACEVMGLRYGVDLILHER